jgi:hypothetical protein
MCGAPNAARLPAMAVAGSVLVLLIAIAVAAVVILRGVRIDAPVGPGDKFAWLVKAMEDCDAEASRAPETLYFLVIPMASSAVDDAEWRRRSLNDIGNAILLTQQVMVEGLNSGGLRITNESYEFRLRDDGTNEVYQWATSAGVKKFLKPTADEIKNFRVQFKTAARANDEWGAAFVHQQGTCYWVNAIIGN